MTRPWLVHGYCPMGCGTTLYLADAGHIVCTSGRCPRPTAADELLSDPETGHIVEFTDDSFTLRHPLRERLDNALFNCAMHAELGKLDGPPVQSGRYRVRQRGTEQRWRWERVD